MKLRRRGSRAWLIGGIILLVIVLAVVAWWWLRPSQQVPIAATVTDSTQSTDTTSPTLLISAMGDMLAHDSIVSQATTASGYDFAPYFASVKSIYDKSDAVFCNPETPAAGTKLGISGYPTFNAPTEFARDLRGTGCDMINLATNHLADKGQAGIDATLDTWAALKLQAMAGANRSAAEQNTVSYFTRNDVKVAFVALADFSNGPLPHDYSVNLYHDTALVDKLLSEARQNADVVLVSAHWGVEDSHEISADQRAAVALFARHNVDVVIGTGPHVLQAVERPVRADGKPMLVWYSIGNMLSSQLQVDELTGGVAQFRLTKNDDGVVVSDVTFTPTFMSYEWSAADKAADNLAARKNLKLQSLSAAEAETQLFGVTRQERLDKVRAWLGDQVKVIE